MSDPKTVVWFADDPKSNTFFFRPLFRSWKFAINTLLFLSASVGTAIVIYKLRSGFGNLPVSIFAFFILGVLNPYFWAIKRHGKIHELCLAGTIAEAPADSPTDVLLKVADDSLNENARNSMFMFGLFLLTVVMWKLVSH